MEKNCYDYIVIGSGSAGSVCAHKLAVNLPDHSILLIEAGGSNDYKEIHNFTDSLYLPENIADKQWNYESTPQKNLNCRTIDVPFAKILGGCSSINQCVYVRGSPNDFNYWPKKWSYENVLQNYKNIEKVNRCEYKSSFRGENGCVQVSGYESKKNELTKKLLKACEKNGYFNDYNIPFKQEQICSPMQFNVVEKYPDYRFDTFTSFIKPLIEVGRNNFTLKTKIIVKKILFKQKRAIGVQCISNNKTFNLYCNKEIIISCGAINTPKLLQLSGIGDKKLLCKLGIDPVENLPAVGQNLQDHLATFVFYKLKNKLPQDHNNLIDVNMFVKGKDGRYPLMMYSITFPKDVPYFGAKKNWYGAESILNIPHSKGYTHIQSNNFQDDPVINYKYLDSKKDYAILIDGIERIRKIFDDVSFVTKEVKPGKNVDLIEYIKNNSYSLCHPCGTCKMTEAFDLNNSVVDSKCRVWNIEGLRIADASIMPEIMSGNLNATCMMIGDKCAEFIIKKLK